MITQALLADGFEIRQYEVGRKRDLVEAGVLSARLIDCRQRSLVAIIEAVRDKGTDPPSGVREPRRIPPGDRSGAETGGL